VANAGSGSPNRLLYAPASGDAPEPPPPTSGDDDAALANDVPLAVSDGADGQRYFYVDVPAGQASLTIAIAGASGDADLHVRFGEKPTTTSWACRPYHPDSNESCTFSNPAAGRWWVLLDAYSAYSATLRATYSGGGGNSGCGGPAHSGWLSEGESAYLPEYAAERSGRHAGALDGPSGADFDLHLQRWNGLFWANVKGATSSDADESLSYDGSPGYYRWRVYAYDRSGAFTHCTRRP
jgi:serine protease